MKKIGIKENLMRRLNLRPERSVLCVYCVVAESGVYNAGTRTEDADH